MLEEEVVTQVEDTTPVEEPAPAPEPAQPTPPTEPPAQDFETLAKTLQQALQQQPKQEQDPDIYRRALYQNLQRYDPQQYQQLAEWEQRQRAQEAWEKMRSAAVSSTLKYELTSKFGVPREVLEQHQDPVGMIMAAFEYATTPKKETPPPTEPPRVASVTGQPRPKPAMADMSAEELALLIARVKEGESISARDIPE